MKNNLKIITIFVLTILILCPFRLFVFADDTNEKEAQYIIDDIIISEQERCSVGSVQEYIDNVLSKNVGVSSEWYILAFAKYKNFDFRLYKNALEEYLSVNESSSASTREKYALSLIATGGDKEQIEMLLASSIGKQGIMSWVFGLHILNNGYICAENDINSVKEKILSLQTENGSWSVMGRNGEVDTTAMAVQSLAPFYTEEKVKNAIDKALDYLSKSQLDNGEFQQYGISNSESVSQVIIALSCLGIDCQNDQRFIKNGKTLLDVLGSFALLNGGYSHVLDGEYNQMATVQALCAMVSYIQKDEINPNFYIFTPKKENEHILESQTENLVDLNISKASNADLSETSSYKTTAVVCIVLITMGVCIVMFVRKSRNKYNYLLVLLLGTISVLFILFTNFSSVEEYYNADKSEISSIGTVMLSIKCDVLSDIDENLDIPDDGIILKNTMVDIQEGATVYDVLLSVTTANKIHIETNGMTENAYVEGIANIYEFDFGDLSGWVYYVNGISPSLSCGSYQLKPGDEIEWRYSLSLGEDIE